MEEPFWQETEDWHTAGEPFRIVQTLPAGSLNEGLTVSHQRSHILASKDHPLDRLRRYLCHEPRGHADMYGGFITPPNDAGANFGVLFWHKDGFSSACGHGTIALGYWAIAKGTVSAPENGTVDVVIDVPSGRVVAQANCQNGRVVHVDFINVASYQYSDTISFCVEYKQMKFPIDAVLMYGGALYACVDAAQFGLDIEPESLPTFIDLQRQIKEDLSFKGDLIYYDEPIYGVCFYREEHTTENSITQKNVVIFADGQVDRSPCGSGTAARVAVLLHEGRMNQSTRLIHKSIVNSVFEGSIDAEAPSPNRFSACIPRVRGEARLTGRHNFFIDPTDVVQPFLLTR